MTPFRLVITAALFLVALYNGYKTHSNVWYALAAIVAVAFVFRLRKYLASQQADSASNDEPKSQL